MPILALLVSDALNADALTFALPAGTVVTTLVITEQEWQRDPVTLASHFAVPIIARSQQEWAKQPHP